MKQKLAFLNLDRNTHHSHHVVPIALACSRLPDLHCTLYIQEVSRKITEKICSHYSNHRCEIKMLTPGLTKKFLAYFKDGSIGCSHYIKKYASTLLDHDVIVTPDNNIGHIIKKKNANKPYFIRCFHGSGDKRYAFREDLDQMFDLFLVAGKKYHKRLVEQCKISEHKCKIIGYTKFDVIDRKKKEKFFPNEKKTILYIPHFDQKLSSWPFWGLQILEHFYQSSEYNLIFAPHINLFKSKRLRNSIDPKYFKADHIYMDLGSSSSIDCTYTINADFYIGDISSQVYEFLYKPRPCIFLNPRKIPYKDNPYYKNWRLGEVIEDLEDLEVVLSRSLKQNPFESLQIKAFNETFSISDELASTRASNEIKKFLDKL